MAWLEDMRAWPQRKKMNFIWSVTGTVILLMIAAWILVGNYHGTSSGGASYTIGSLVNNIKNNNGTGK